MYENIMWSGDAIIVICDARAVKMMDFDDDTVNCINRKIAVFRLCKVSPNFF